MANNNASKRAKHKCCYLLEIIYLSPILIFNLSTKPPFNSKTIQYDSLDGEVYHRNITFMSKKDVFNHVFNWVSDDYPDMETRIVRTTIRKYLNDVVYGY